MSDHRMLPGRLVVTAALVLTVAVARPGGAQTLRETNCPNPPAPSAPGLPVETLSFKALTAKHLQALTVVIDPVPQHVLQTTIDRGGRFNEIERGATVVALTKQGRPAKLLVTVSGSGLLIREMTTYSADGDTVTQATNLWLSKGRRLDLDRGLVVSTEAETDVRWVRSGPARILIPANGARLTVLRPRIAVPIIAHLMTGRGSTVPLDSVMPETKLKELFALEGKLNEIWDRAGLLFFLAGIERCTHSVRDLIPEGPEPEVDGVPNPADDCRSFFRRVSSVYNLPMNAAYQLPADAGAVYGADLYLWMTIGFARADKLLGYSAMQRPDGPNHGPGAIWINPARCLIAGGECPARIAHEIGHFLGLCHSCYTAATPPAERGLCGFCTNVRACSLEQRDLLMRDEPVGERLAPAEIRLARQKAAEHRWRAATAAGSP